MEALIHFLIYGGRFQSAVRLDDYLFLVCIVAASIFLTLQLVILLLNDVALSLDLGNRILLPGRKTAIMYVSESMAVCTL